MPANIGAPTTIPSAGPNGVVITTFHPRLPKTYPPRIYREAPAPTIGSGPPSRPLYLASPLTEPDEASAFQIPRTNHVRTMELPENKPPPRWNGRTPYFYTNYSSNPVDPPLAETDNIGRYTNPRPRTGPRLRFQFARREPQRPARPVVRRRPEPTVVEEEILEEGGGASAGNDGVRRELDGREEIEGGMDMFHLNGALLF